MSSLQRQQNDLFLELKKFTSSFKQEENLELRNKQQIVDQEYKKQELRFKSISQEIEELGRKISEVRLQMSSLS